MSALGHLLLHVWRIVSSRWAVYLLMVASLALSFCAALIIAVYVKDELTYDRFLTAPGSVYLVSASYGPQGTPLVASDKTPAGVARWISSDLPDVQAVARLSTAEWPVWSARRHVKERFYWADGNIFDLLPLPFVAGDPKTALSAANSAVLTEDLARAYFGSTDAMGRSLQTQNGVVLRVTGILRNLPTNTHLDRGMFVRGPEESDMLRVFDSHPAFLWANAYTYVRFTPKANLSVEQQTLLQASRRHWEGDNNLPEGFAFIPLQKLHFQPHGDGELRPRGHLNSVIAFCVVAIVILAVAGINFSGLVLAEANERISEMALRTALGARRIDLIVYLMQEALVVNLFSAFVAVAMAERLLPVLNLHLDISLSLWSSPIDVIAFQLATAIIVAVLSGAYSTLVIARPTPVNQPGPASAIDQGASFRWRGWVVAQLSLVVVLLVSSHTLSRQWSYGTDGALHFDGDDVVMIQLGSDPMANQRFRQDLETVKGVEAVAESFGAPTTDYVRPGWIRRPGKALITLTRNSVHPDFFKVFKVPILAGRNLQGTFLSPETPREVLINLQTVKALGFADPLAAVGHDIEYETDRTRMRSTIVGVVPDMRFSTLYDPMQPMIFDGFSKYFTQINVRLAPETAASALAQMDQLWQRDAGGIVPIERRSYHDYLMRQYHDLRQQMRVFNIVSAVAILLSILGLTGLSIFLTRRHMREMAIRRALGATWRDIVLLQTVPFFRPIVFASLIAWPVGFVVLKAWLGTFSEHIGLAWYSFAGATLISVIFAIATVGANSILTAGNVSSPSSLRHL